MSKDKHKEPFLYIQQPEISFPQTNMQSFYSSSEQRKKKGEKTPSPQEESALDAKQNTNEETRIKEETAPTVNKETEKTDREQKKYVMKQESIVEYEVENREKQEEKQQKPQELRAKPSFRRVKSFKEMDIPEQIQYLLNFPKQLPPVPCYFEYEQTTVRGILLQEENDMILIKQLNGMDIEMPTQQLKSIKMMGLR